MDQLDFTDNQIASLKQSENSQTNYLDMPAWMDDVRSGRAYEITFHNSELQHVFLVLPSLNLELWQVLKSPSGIYNNVKKTKDDDAPQYVLNIHYLVNGWYAIPYTKKQQKKKKGTTGVEKTILQTHRVAVETPWPCDVGGNGEVGIQFPRNTPSGLRVFIPNSPNINRDRTKKFLMLEEEFEIVLTGPKVFRGTIPIQRRSYSQANKKHDKDNGSIGKEESQKKRKKPNNDANNSSSMNDISSYPSDDDNNNSNSGSTGHGQSSGSSFTNSNGYSEMKVDDNNNQSNNQNSSDNSNSKGGGRQHEKLNMSVEEISYNSGTSSGEMEEVNDSSNKNEKRIIIPLQMTAKEILIDDSEDDDEGSDTEDRPVKKGKSNPTDNGKQEPEQQPLPSNPTSEPFPPLPQPVQPPTNAPEIPPLAPIPVPIPPIIQPVPPLQVVDPTTTALTATLALATKVLNDMNTLIQYLDSVDPVTLKSSHMLTAQGFVTEFVSNLQQQIDSPASIPQQPGGTGMVPNPAVSSALKPTKSLERIMPDLVEKVLQLPPPVHNPQQLSMYKAFSSKEIELAVKLQQPLSDIQFDQVKLEDFDLLETLGCGTFGHVRLCKHKKTKRYFCIKILAKSRVVKLRQVDHIKNEKNVLKNISHPFIVKLYCTFQDSQCLYLLLEFIPGGELFNYIRRASRLPDHIAKVYSAEIILAFEYLHGNNVLYRDLKPENILIDTMGHIKVTDFGFAKFVTERTQSMCGTPEYIAPEIIMCRGHDKAVDWWSLGVLIFEMLAGYPPFSDEGNKTVFEKILSDRPEIPEYFYPDARDLIQKLLVVDPQRRLGNLKGGASDVKNHPWFQGIDWDGLLQKKYVGCLNPGVMKEGDTHNFYKYSDVDLPDLQTENPEEYDKLFGGF